GRHVFGAFHGGHFYLIDGKNGPGQYSISATSPASRWFVYRFAEDKIEQVGLYEHPWPSAFGHITIDGSNAYVSDYNYGMWTFDLSNPAAPKRIGGAVTAGESDALWLDGDRAYQWQTFGGAVFLLDVSRPGAPQRLGEYWDGAWLPYGNTRRGNYTVAGKDGFLYVPRQRKGIVIADVRNPASPKAIGLFQGADQKPVQVRGASIDVQGDRAFVLSGKSLLSYDVTNAGQPKLTGTVGTPAADTLCARGDIVYLGVKQGTFSLVDVSKPEEMKVLSSIELQPYCPDKKMGEVISGIAVSRGYAYLTARGPRSWRGAMFLHIVDVRDPKNPRWVRTYDPRPDLPDAPCFVWADFYQDIIADGDFLFIGDYGQIECYDISIPESPEVFDIFHAGCQWSVGRKRGDYLYVPSLSGHIILNVPSSSQKPVGKVEALAKFHKW
ncbi:MAG: hypothetical protein QF886_11540, partial [Planctomycetota bacterium]|nr:hypothetical protein [Planctomycetota bacterium]